MLVKLLPRCGRWGLSWRRGWGGGRRRVWVGGSRDVLESKEVELEDESQREMENNDCEETRKQIGGLRRPIYACGTCFVARYRPTSTKEQPGSRGQKNAAVTHASNDDLEGSDRHATSQHRLRLSRHVRDVGVEVECQEGARQGERSQDEDPLKPLERKGAEDANGDEEREGVAA